MGDHRIGPGADSSHDAPLEFHRRYIDIQMVLTGEETIGWSPLSAEAAANANYNSVRDIAFLTDVPRAWFQLRVGEFAVFFPHVCACSLGGDTPVLKSDRQSRRGLVSHVPELQRLVPACSLDLCGNREDLFRPTVYVS